MVNTTTATSSGDARQQPGLSCEECRRRKARCDRVRPRCGICAESGRTCVVVDKRSQRGPRKGQLKDLRSRLMLLEQRLGGQLDSSNLPKERDRSPKPSEKVSPECDQSTLFPRARAPILGWIWVLIPGRWFGLETDADTYTRSYDGVNSDFHGSLHLRRLADRTWHISKLLSTNSYSAIGDSPVTYAVLAGDADTSPARTALRSAMRTIASAMVPQFCDIGQIMYALTRRMLETQDACGETGLPWMARLKPPQEQQEIDHERTQAWLLLAYYDVLRKSGLQAFVTARRAFRLLQLSGLYDMDAHRSHISTSPAETSWNAQLCLSNNEADEPILQQTWISVEEKRRTVWSAFLLDRLSTMLNDQPMMLMGEIMYTRLPMAEAEFQSGSQEPVSPMGFLVEATDESKAGNGINMLPPFAHCVVVANLFARCMTHGKLGIESTPISAPDSQDFWQRHPWLASAAAKACETEVSRCDPMLVFTRILGYSHSKCHLTSWQTLDHHLMAMACKPAAHQAASEVVGVIKTAPRIAFFKVFCARVYLTLATCRLAVDVGTDG
ncbi:Sorbicillinoid biosynthetic cluster transcription factor sor4 [Metarhizium anisopliae]|nr:Sorbicillinoid biosynthetic cluster transcription factor sor4 [Metarhizium anisopliae]